MIIINGSPGWGATLRLLAVASVFGLWLPGCASLDVRVGSGRQGNVTSTTTQVQLATDSAVGAAIIVALLFANEIRYFLQSPDGRRTPVSAAVAEQARLAPPRVQPQDCTRPVDISGGNLICR